MSADRELITRLSSSQGVRFAGASRIGLNGEASAVRPDLAIDVLGGLF